MKLCISVYVALAFNLYIGDKMREDLGALAVLPNIDTSPYDGLEKPKEQEVDF